MGIEYYEAVPYTLASGMLCLAVFRALAGTHFGQLWPYPGDLLHLDVRHILLGVAMGVLGAAISYCWIKFTKSTKKFLKVNFKLDEHATPVPCGLLGGFIIGIVGMLLPPTMFWGEMELKSWANPSIPLAHVWPQSGIWGDGQFLQDNPTAGMHVLLGVAKLFAITVTLCAGFRGGFIFPLMTAGASIGTAIHIACVAWVPSIMDDFPMVVFAMCLAGAINCAITRTPLATPLILSTLSGHGICSVPVLASCLVSLFLTKDIVMIASQTHRKFEEDEQSDDDAATETDTNLEDGTAP
jgi:H+/Cl- antiporter ClcA